MWAGSAGSFAPSFSVPGRRLYCAFRWGDHGVCLVLASCLWPPVQTLLGPVLITALSLYPVCLSTWTVFSISDIDLMGPQKANSPWATHHNPVLLPIETCRLLWCTYVLRTRRGFSQTAMPKVSPNACWRSIRVCKWYPCTVAQKPTVLHVGSFYCDYEIKKQNGKTKFWNKI